ARRSGDGTRRAGEGAVRPVPSASLLSARLWHPPRTRTTREPASVDKVLGALPREPPEVAAEGEVAEAGGGVDEEVGDDQGGGAAAELVEAAEEKAEGEGAEEAGARGGVREEVGDDRGGCAARGLVGAAEEQAEGEVAEEAAEALVEV